MNKILTEAFKDINNKYTKPGALLQGRRPIGKTIAKRIEALYDVDYHSFSA